VINKDFISVIFVYIVEPCKKKRKRKIKTKPYERKYTVSTVPPTLFIQFLVLSVHLRLCCNCWHFRTSVQSFWLVQCDRSTVRQRMLVYFSRTEDSL